MGLIGEFFEWEKTPRGGECERQKITARGGGDVWSNSEWIVGRVGGLIQHVADAYMYVYVYM